MKNVPKLRFNGFSNEWEEKKLGDFLEFYSTNSLSRECLNYESGKIRNIHYGDIHMKFPTILDAKKEIIPFINKDIDISKIKEDSYCKDGDLIIADASEDYNDIGKAIEIENIDNDKVLAGLHTILARDTKGVTVKRFKGYLLLNDAVRKQIKTLAAGAKVLGISKTNLVKVAVKLPSKEEQEKIANFLTKVDKLIEKQDEKVSNLEQYKKGMMQKIFSQEIRFKKDDGGEYPEWEERNISEIANLTSSKRIFLSDYVNEGIPFYRGKEITELKANKKPRDILYITKEKYNEIKETYGVPKIGDILLTAVGTLGNSYVINNEESFYFKDGNLIWFKEININATFLDLYLSSPHGQKKVLDSAIGSTQKALTIVALNKIKINVPDIHEQNKIVNFLSKIDSIVEKEKEKLEELRVWKKGLLQWMFV